MRLGGANLSKNPNRIRTTVTASPIHRNGLFINQNWGEIQNITKSEEGQILLQNQICRILPPWYKHPQSAWMHAIDDEHHFPFPRRPNQWNAVYVRYMPDTDLKYINSSRGTVFETNAILGRFGRVFLLHVTIAKKTEILMDYAHSVCIITFCIFLKTFCWHLKHKSSLTHYTLCFTSHTLHLTLMVSH